MSSKSTIVLTLLLIIGYAFASTDSHGCWTCAAGWTHWYDLKMSAPSNGDQCQCLKFTSTTTTTTKAITTTVAPTYNCWTCAAGWTHWYELGMSSPSNGDKCQCILIASAAGTKTTTTTTTTAKPTTITSTTATTRNCWTCAAGWSHWYDLGYSAPTNGDQCQCIATSETTTTTAPTSTSKVTTTTASPSSITTTSTAAPTTMLAAFLAAMTPSSSSPGSVSFSPGVTPYSSSNPPPLSLVSTLMDTLISSTKYRTVMMYYLDTYTMQLAAQKGLKVVGIVYVVPGQDNTALINNAISVVNAYPDTIIALSCGNEMGANYGLTDAVVSAVSQCVSGLKNAGIKHPIGSIDTYYSWCMHSEKPCTSAWTAVSNLVDWIGLNDYPWYDNTYSGTWPCVTHTQAAQITLEKHRTVAALYGKPVVLTEFGWPSAPSGTSINSKVNVITGAQCGVANDANQKTMLQNVIDLYRMNGLPCNTFEAFREAWKGSSEQDVETQFGFCIGTSPYTCKNMPN